MPVRERLMGVEEFVTPEILETLLNYIKVRERGLGSPCQNMSTVFYFWPYLAFVKLVNSRGGRYLRELYRVPTILTASLAICGFSRIIIFFLL